MTEVLGEDAPASAKPRTASLLKSMDLDSVTLDDALRLLTLPRTLGEIDGEPVTAQNGRYGPYVKKGTDSRSLEREEQLFTVTLDQAKELFAQPKPRGRAARAAAAPPLRELGEDPASGKPIVLREGRFGPVRDRRRDQRVAAQGRRARVDHAAARGRAAGRAPGGAAVAAAAAARSRPKTSTSGGVRGRSQGRRGSRVMARNRPEPAQRRRDAHR